MIVGGGLLAAALAFCLGAGALPSDKGKDLLAVKGNPLVYGYDRNVVYGENVELVCRHWTGTARYIRIDLAAPAYYASGDVILTIGDKKAEGDDLSFDPGTGRGILRSYGDRISETRIGEWTAGDSSSLPGARLEQVNLAEIQKSLIYFSGPSLIIRETGDVDGFGMTLYLEGLPSLAFRKVRLSEGIRQRMSGLSLDRIWFTKSQGLTGRMSYLARKGDKINSLTQLSFEERSILKGEQALKRQLSLMTSTTVSPGRELRLGLAGNYNSSGLWNSQVWMNKMWGEAFQTQVDFQVNKPLGLREEVWIGLQSMLSSGTWGNLSVLGRYEIQNQALGSLSYGVSFLRNFQFLLNAAYSRIKAGEGFSEIASGSAGLSWNSRLFNLAADYYLNADLFGNQLLSQPQLRLSLNPVAFYGGILQAGFSNIFIHNSLKQDERRETLYSNNILFNISTRPLPLRPGLNISLTGALEQFLEKKGRNFTSGGLILNAVQEFGRGLALEGFWSVQSRRRTRGWLIEGTTSQDISLLARAGAPEVLGGWVSFSYDPKNGQWRQAFAELGATVVKNWRIHSLLNYDFLLGKTNNIDVYLIREAGRFELRFVWRSLSGQFLVELLPR